MTTYGSWLCESALGGSQRALEAEIIVLRHQLNVLRRKSPKRVAFNNLDRLVFAGLYRLSPGLLDALKILRPQTVIRWHRAGFRAYWRWKSRPRGGRRRTPTNIRQLIREMSVANPLWGAPRIHGELLKVGINVGQTTVAKYMARRRQPPSQGWKTFLRNHADGIASMDLFVVPTISFRLLYGFLILHHSRRKLLWLSVTAHPGAQWIACQLTEGLLSAPFSDASARFGLDSYRFIFADENFSIAFGTTLMLSAGMTLIAVPLGTGLAFLMVRTDLPGRHWLEPLILLPIFIPGLVMGFGYMVALGPGGMLSEFFENSDWAATWNLYAFPALVVIAGLAHVPYVYLYVSPAMRNLDGDAEQAARSAGAGAWKVAFDVTLPMAMPAILFATVLVFFFGFELFGLPLVLGDRQGIVVLSTYLYKLGNTLAAPPYQHMAVVVVMMAAIGLPLVFMQRALLTETGRAVARQGKHLLFARFQLGLCRWPTFLLIALWLAIMVLLPVAAIVLRSFLVAEDGGLAGWGALTLEHFQALLQHAAAARSIINTVLMGTIGGGIAVACYTALALTVHCWPSRWAQAVDYLALMPRAIPGLAVGLVLLWVLVFIKPITPLREMLVSVWLAYAVVWLACGTQIVRGRLEKLDPELEEIARTVGATQSRAGFDITFPLLRKSVLAAWLLIFLMFVRDYSTAIYLIAPGNEIAGPLLVSLWAQSSMDLVSALSVIIIAILGTGALIVSRLGVCPYD